jgi:autotransporter-associated beta strand protein
VTAASIQAALQALSTVGVGNVSVTAATATTTTGAGQLPALYDITFQGAMAGFNEQAISVALVNAAGASGQGIFETFPGNLGNFSKNGTGTLVLSGASANTFGAIARINEGVVRAAKNTAFGAGAPAVTNEIQRIAIGGTPTDASTTFTLTYNGRTTAAITYSATPATTAADIQSKLGALLGIGAANISVSAVSNLIFDITFQNALGQADIASMTSALVNAGGATAPTMSTILSGTTAGVNVTSGATVEDVAVARLNSDAQRDLILLQGVAGNRFVVGVTGVCR